MNRKYDKKAREKSFDVGSMDMKIHGKSCFEVGKKLVMSCMRWWCRVKR